MSVAAPVGFVLVPVEPTPRMVAEGYGLSDLMVDYSTHDWRAEMRTAWAAMLAAAPKAASVLYERGSDIPEGETLADRDRRIYAQGRKDALEEYEFYAPKAVSEGGATGLREALDLFMRAAYPVAAEINPRGYNWSEAYLDQARQNALAASPTDATGKS